MDNRKAILFRVSPELKDWLKDRADFNCRTMNGEILALLKATKETDQKQEAA